MIRKPRLGRLTQGSIFCGGVAEDYRDDPVWGLVITARCDTAQDKTPIVNYLPIVRIEDWLRVHGARLVAERATSDLRERMSNALRQEGLSPSLLDVHKIEDILAVHFSEGAVGTKARTKSGTRQRVSGYAKEMEELVGFKSGKNVEARHLLGVYRKLTDGVLTELITHRAPGYYFVSDMGQLTEHYSNYGYVALLREVRHLNRRVAAQIVAGCSEDKASSEGVCFTKFDFACTVAEIESPWMEHLMQTFCNLFGRIGVEDHDKEKAVAIRDFVVNGGMGSP